MLTLDGDDNVTMSDVLALATLTLGTGVGADAVRVEFLAATDVLQVSVADGNDVVAMTDILGLGDINLRLGAGEDVASGTRVDTEGAVLFDGGQGVDTLTYNGISGEAGTQIVSFEVVPP